MKEIFLTQGKIALVDDEDFEYLNQWKWCISAGARTDYAKRAICIESRCKTVLMHRVILNVPSNMEIDHIDCNGLNNQKNNLRIVTKQQNLQNRFLLKHNSSGFIGVSLFKDRQKWQAQIRVDNKAKHLGFFLTKEEAAVVYNKAALKYRGEFARLNEVILSQ